MAIDDGTAPDANVSATCDQNQHIPLALIPSVFVVVASAFSLPMT